MFKRHLNNKGLSLVEVVLSAMLLAVVAAALFASYSNANNIIAMSKNKIVALTWAQSLMEGGMSGSSATDPAVPNWLTVEKAGVSGNLGLNNQGALLTEMKATVTWTE